MELSRRGFITSAAAGVVGAAALSAAPAMAAEAAPAAAALGTGSATVRGFGGDVSVTLSVDGGAIVDCLIEGPDETPERGGHAIEVMQPAYIEAGSLDIDVVAGATVTSNAVKSAAAQAYAIATGASAGDYEIHMAPGQYTGTAVGFWGIWDLPITITVNETSILAIEAPEARDMQGETEGYFNPVKAQMFPRIIKHQSTTVDTVTGCTASSNAAKQAIEDALSQALAAGGSDPAAIEAFHKPVAKEAEGEVEEITCDIAVVGLSTCGLLSVKAALDKLLVMSGRTAPISIVGVEKCGKLGGHSFNTHSPNIINPTRRLEECEDPTKYLCDTDVLRADWLAHTTGNDGAQRAKEELVDLFIAETGNTMDWLIYKLGWMMGEPRGNTDFSTTDFASKTCWYYYANSGGDKFYESNEDRRAVVLSYYDAIVNEAKGAGGKFLLETEGYELIYDEATSTVKGVKARNLHTGKEYVINANAVIMSTGGFLNDPELQEQLLPENLRGTWRQNGNTQNTGSMIKAALAIGAATYNADLCPITMEIGLPFFMHHFPINEKPGITKRTGRYNTWTFNDIPLYLCASIDSLAVDKHGVRICNEYGIGNGIADRVPPDTWVAGPYFYSIWSQDQIDELAASGFSSENVKRVAAYIQQGGFTLDEPRPEVYEAMDAAVEEGLAWKGDTLEDLAAQLDMPADALAATVARYNELCEAGEDTDFGKEPQWLHAIGAGPYYAIKAMNVPYGGGGCFDVDTQIRALKEDHVTPINGLYIGGQDSFGVLNNPDKNYIGYGGVDQGWHVLTGRLMGENAADYVFNNFGLVNAKE